MRRKPSSIDDDLEGLQPGPRAALEELRAHDPRDHSRRRGVHLLRLPAFRVGGKTRIAEANSR